MTGPDRTPPAGLLVVDKPGGMTSHDVVARIRRLARTRRVGHAGTLDPMATGVLLVGVGRATRLLGHLASAEKAYDATVRLGLATSTDDAEGEPLAAVSASRVGPAQVREAATGFVGELWQRPSSVSAVKVGGRRSYARVRAGEAVELPPRRVTVHELVVSDVRAGGDVLDVDVSLRCSSGTYVRAIARDLGELLGVGGHLTRLRRTAAEPFTLADARALDALGDDLADGSGLLGLSEAARRCFPTYHVDADQARAVGHGRRLEVSLGAAGPVAVLGTGETLLALYEQRGDVAAPVAVLV